MRMPRLPRENRPPHKTEIEERIVMKKTIAACLGLLTAMGGLTAQESGVLRTRAAQKPADGAEPPAVPPPSIILHERHGHVTPFHGCLQHTGGGNIDIAQPTPDTVIITMTGAAVVGPCACRASAQNFALEQCFEIAAPKPLPRPAKLTIEARVIGLLRSAKKTGSVAEESGACATVSTDTVEVVTVCAPAHSVSAGENLSINDHAGPVSAPILPGKYTLHQAFHVGVTEKHFWFGCKPSSAEFAPDPALDPLWIGYWEPFHGAIKKDFGFQVILRVAPPE
jgi:hypothetical protein